MCSIGPACSHDSLINDCLSQIRSKSFSSESSLERLVSSILKHLWYLMPINNTEAVSFEKSAKSWSGIEVSVNWFYLHSISRTPYVMSKPGPNPIKYIFSNFTPIFKTFSQLCVKFLTNLWKMNPTKFFKIYM
jgi:hypothetical protein